MPGEEMEEGGEQEGGGWDVDEELELPPDLVSGFWVLLGIEVYIVLAAAMESLQV